MKLSLRQLQKTFTKKTRFASEIQAQRMARREHRNCGA